MKVIFLDIDGVLNSKETIERHDGFVGIDKVLAERFKRILRETGAIVVLSSMWRLNQSSVKEVEDKVCKLDSLTEDFSHIRGEEIAKWLEGRDVEKYAILDDDSDMLQSQLSNFFKTSFATGLTEEIANKVIEHLK